MLKRTFSGGFSLIELLVVIAIIAVLVSVLVPQLSKARDSARKIQCQANLRAMYQGWIGYTSDNKEAPPTIYNSQSSYPQRKTWYEAILRYTTSTDSNILYGALNETVFATDANRTRYPAHQPIFRCPSTYGPHTGVPWDANQGAAYWDCYFANNFWGVDQYGNSSNGGNWNYFHPTTGNSRPVRDWNSYRQDRNGGRTIIIGETADSWIASHTGASYYYDGTPLLARDRFTLHGGPNNGLLGDGGIVSKVNTITSVYDWHTQTH